jgi:ElaB/YqjD/DUF883 family membrane-anchored ribosome-binding protein
MAGDFRTMITDGEDLLKAAATVSGEGFAAARRKFDVRGNPWTAVGIAVAAGALLGFLAARR